MEKPMMSVPQAIVKYMEQEGCQYAFCVPGESYLGLMDAMYESNISVISTRHEGGASFMAEAYAKATGNCGIAMATRGVGAANLSIGIHTAFQDSTPLVVFIGQVSRRFKGREGFQEVNLEQFFAPITKWTVEIQHAHQVVEIMQRAFFIAKSGRPGPVVISLPEDLLQETGIFEIEQAPPSPKPQPNENELELTSNLLKDAKKPLIIAGGGINSANARKELLLFAEKMNIPVLSAFRRHDVLPNQHPLYAGHLGLGTPKEIINCVKESDVILAIGTRLSEVTTQDYSLFSHQQKIIHIDIDYQSMLKGTLPHLTVVSDAKLAIQSMMKFQLTAINKSEEWARKCRLAYEKTLSKPTSDKQKVVYYEMYKILEKYLPADSIITNDAGNFAGWLHRYYQFSETNLYIGPTSGAMGYGLPAAIGAKIAHPDRVVVSLSGDGGFMMTMQELETAKRYNIPIINLVFNNAMYGTIKMHQQLTFPGREVGTKLSDVSFAKLAHSLQINNYYVKSATEFEHALLKALSNVGSCSSVIEIEMDPDQISVSNTLSTMHNKT
jgi:acetolactate synthase I/II/III large subunit